MINDRHFLGQIQTNPDPVFFKVGSVSGQPQHGYNCWIQVSILRIHVKKKAILAAGLYEA